MSKPSFMLPRPGQYDKSVAKTILIVGLYIHIAVIVLLGFLLVIFHSSYPSFGYLIPIIMLLFLLLIFNGIVIDSVHVNYKSTKAVLLILEGLITIPFVFGIAYFVGGILAIAHNSEQLRKRELAKRVPTTSPVRQMQNSLKSSNVSLVEEDIRKIAKLKEDGLITEEEFVQFKKDILEKKYRS